MRKKRIGSLAAVGVLAAMIAAPAAMLAQGSGTVLKPAELQKLVPATVFYRGQTAPTQVRNSGGVRFSDGYLILATLVDTSGYSNGVAAKYQGQLMTEIPIEIDGKRLPAGVYGIGFLDNHTLLVTDIGAHDVLSVPSATDSEIKRPRPLEVLPNPSGGFRLYAGRSYVVLKR